MFSKPKLASTLVVTFTISMTLCGCNNKADAEKRTNERAKRQQQAAELKQKMEARRENECKAIREAATSVDASSSEVVLACTKFRSGECNYKVELMFRLEKIGKNDALGQISKIGADCTDELSFALKYSLEAYQECARIVETATEEAYQFGKEEGGQKCSNNMEPPDDGDRDYGRGRR